MIIRSRRFGKYSLKRGQDTVKVAMFRVKNLWIVYLQFYLGIVFVLVCKQGKVDKLDAQTMTFLALC